MKIGNKPLTASCDLLLYLHSQGLGGSLGVQGMTYNRGFTHAFADRATSTLRRLKSKPNFGTRQPLISRNQDHLSSELSLETE